MKLSTLKRKHGSKSVLTYVGCINDNEIYLFESLDEEHCYAGKAFRGCNLEFTEIEREDYEVGLEAAEEWSRGNLNDTFEFYSKVLQYYNLFHYC